MSTMKKRIIIAIGTLAIVLIAVGAYGLTRQGEVPEDEGRTTKTPIGLPDFPSGTPTTTPTPTPGTQPDSTPDPGQTLIPDAEPDIISVPQPDPGPAPGPTPTPTPTTDPTLGSETLTINTPSGPIKINNVLLNPKEVYPYDWGVLVEETSQYAFAYYKEEQTFAVSILDANVKSARAAFEQDFLDILVISEEDACKLDVTIQVQGRINDEFGGINFGLSFCPNGVPL